MFRYSTRVSLAELLHKLRAQFLTQTGGSEECSRLFLQRGPAATSGVEGLYTLDGSQTALAFLWQAKGPKDVVEMVNHFLVSRLCNLTYPHTGYRSSGRRRENRRIAANT